MFAGPPLSRLGGFPASGTISLNLSASIQYNKSMTKPLHCPTCEKPFRPEDSPRLPFCSLRCAEIDLGRWLNEQNGLPVEPDEAELEAAFLDLSDRYE